MMLDRIVLENFRQYFGRNKIEFARDPQRRVTVIHGVNGAGKTSLFIALNWCLYGKSVDNVKIIDNVGELMSKEALSRSVVGDRLIASVELSFFHDGDRFIARRALRGSKHTDGSFLSDNGDFFTLMRARPNASPETINNPLGMINAILPSNVRTYFLFDGEKIDNFAKPEAAKEVKEAIKLVLKLEVLERARRHLEAAADEYRRELKRMSSGESQTLLEREEQTRAELDRDEKRKGELLAEISSARRKIVDIDAQLRTTKDARELQEKRSSREQAQREFQQERETLVGQIRELAIGAHFAIAQPAVDRALEILDQKRERGEIPSNIRQQFVQDLLAQNRCICGRPLHDGTLEHQSIQGLLRNSLPGSLENDVLDTTAALRPFQERLVRRCSDLNLAMRRRAELTDAIKKLDAELSDIQIQLKGSKIEEISGLEKQRSEFLANIDSANLEIGGIDERMKKLSKEFDELRKQREKVLKEEKRVQVLSKKLSLAEQSADAIGEIYHTFANEMRLKIEAKTKEIFHRLAWKGEDHFSDIRLSSDYNLEVIDKYGRPARPELSAGERQVLSLSFITAMAQVSDEEAPLVMDTPFGRLSSQHRNTITEHLPNLASQLILFVTDEELRDQARKNLETRIGGEYRLQFDRQTSCTSIEEEKVL
ncbi:MAG: AAA family ATPase [Roseiflexaceae bacterium]|nr:AAA family ATPase [Roseiflexaceae bacterium]